MLEKLDIIGVDEAGRGPLLGPVVACAMYIVDYNDENFDIVNDSKKLSEKKRKYLYEYFKNSDKIKYAISLSDEKIIDDINILNATFKAMNEAIEKLNIDKKIIVDGNQLIRNCKREQECLIKGDSKNLTIALASIFAKVVRDELMYEYDKKYPNYEICSHKGYGTKKHYEAIQKYGILDIHRKTFLKKLINR